MKPIPQSQNTDARAQQQLRADINQRLRELEGRIRVLEAKLKKEGK